MVELVAKTVGVGRYADFTPEEIIEAVARHGRIKQVGKLTKYLMDNSHWSPLEHISMTFLIETSRAISTQKLRHKSFSFQEWSQRYETPNPERPFQPIELRLQSESNRQSSTDVIGTVDYATNSISIDNMPTSEQMSVLSDILTLLGQIDELYKRGLKAGIARECMRNILPMATTTHIHMTGSLRSWLAFLNVRFDHHAQKEIRVIVYAIGEALEKEMPLVFSHIDWRAGMFM